MRGVWLSVWLLLLAVVLAAPGQSAGGLVLVGAGEGTAVALDGSYRCEDVPFVVQVHFFPGNAAIAEFTWASGGATCPALYTGGSVAIGNANYDAARTPPVSWTFSCRGSESEGVTCGNFLFMGPSNGVGSLVWLVKRGAIENFDGAFMAA